MRINRRLVLLVTVPLAVAIAFSVLALAPATRQAIQAHRLTAMVDAAASASELTYRLQRERAAATALVAGQGTEVAFQRDSEATDTGIDGFRRDRGELSSVPGNAEAAVQRIDRFLEELPSLRAQVRSGGSTLSAVAFGYRIVIADLIDYRDGIAQADGVNAGVADHIRAAAALSRASEHIARQQVAVIRALAGGGFTPASQRTFEATRLGYTESIGVMFALSPQQWRSWLERTLSGSRALTAQRLEDQVGRSAVDERLTVSPRVWQKATSDRLALLRSVERRVDDSVLTRVTSTRTELAWWAGGEASLVLLTLVSVIIVAVRLGRVMILRLRNLRNAAHDVAHKRLPQVMAELSEPGALSGATPEQVAERSGNPVQSTGEDEIGEVGEAFNAVHYEAVRLAALQAHSHERFAETLVGVARRGAQLTGVMVSELDAVQRDESDPERMKVLFALDHLAVRMERNTNSLLVLGGYGHGRARSSDAECSTVIVAAAQQIEQFNRVDLGILEPGIAITARVVHDLAHILAELLDNATRFSPPDKQVGVTVWRLWDRAMVQIVDEGVGITAERRAALNACLAEPQTDVGAVWSMGLHVVARLAARHGIIVELRESEGPGTIAEVTLPRTVLAAAPRKTAPEPHSVFSARPGADHRAIRPLTRLGQVRSRGSARTADDPADSDRYGSAPAGGTAESSGPHGAERQHGTASSPRPPEPSERPVRKEPADRVAGVSTSGLPLRRPQPPDQWPRYVGRDGAGQRSTTAATSPPRRDSRQISDVLAAYAQGINRSTNHRGRSTAADPSRSTDDATH